jgi:hypothetical protein
MTPLEAAHHLCDRSGEWHFGILPETARRERGSGNPAGFNCRLPLLRPGGKTKKLRLVPEAGIIFKDRPVSGHSVAVFPYH